MFLIGERHLYGALTLADLVLHTWRGSHFAFEVQLLVPGSYHDALTTESVCLWCAHGSDSVSEDQIRCAHIASLSGHTSISMARRCSYMSQLLMVHVQVFSLYLCTLHNSCMFPCLLEGLSHLSPYS